MECERLNRLVRAWYVQVQDESLAPARMVEFMEKHLEDCDDCLADPDVIDEVKKITALVLPPSKMTKPVKSAKPKDVGAPGGEAEAVAVTAPAESGDTGDSGEVEIGDDVEEVDSGLNEETLEVPLVPEPE